MMSPIGIFPQGSRSQSAVDTVVDTVRRLLVERKLKPGDLLPSENEIASVLAISRGSIREAMKILSAFGVVEIRRGNGTYVASSVVGMLFDPALFNLLVTPHEIGELAELRSLVEEGIVKLAIEHAQDSDFSAIGQICDEMTIQADSGALRNGDSGKDMLGMDRLYHSELGRLTGNRLVAQVYDFVIDLLAPTMRPGFGIETHLKLVRALRERNTELALDMVREHDDVWKDLNIKAKAE